jgi:hypothetical protein
MEAYGLTEEDYAGQLDEVEEVIIWEENAQAFQVFSFMDTQWRIGMNGVEGLDYNVLYKKLDRMNLGHDDYEQLFSDVQIMEYAHLEESARYRAEQAKQSE